MVEADFHIWHLRCRSYLSGANISDIDIVKEDVPTFEVRQLMYEDLTASHFRKS